MARRNDQAALAAANAASDAARTLQQRGQEVRQEVRPETPVSEAPKRPEPKVEQSEPRNVEKMLGNRPHKQAMDDLLKNRGLVEEEPKEEAAEAVVEAKAAPAVEKPTETAPPVENVTEAPKTVRVKVD